MWNFARRHSAGRFSCLIFDPETSLPQKFGNTHFPVIAKRNDRFLTWNTYFSNLSPSFWRHTALLRELCTEGGLLPSLCCKSPQTLRYGFNGGSHARLWPGSAARNASDARFRERFSASLAALASLVPHTALPPAAGRCFGSCGRSVPTPGDCLSRDSSSASAASAPWRCLRRY